nr:MAG TPA_asm: major tail protein [Caudoviricetes sp.]
MAENKRGVTTETVDRFMVDAGAVYINLDEPDERLLGATRGGNTFMIEQDVYNPEIDNVPGALKGARRIIEVRPRLTANLLEISKDNLMIALVGSQSVEVQDSTAATVDKITRERNITVADYIKNIALVGTISGSGEPAIFKVFDALQDENFEIATENRGEGVLALTFSGHFDPANLNKEPWEIIFPKNDGLQSGVTPGV